MRTRRAHIGYLALAAVALCGSCGGGGGSPYVPPPPAPLAITSTSFSDAIRGQSYSVYLRATGGTTPYTWSLASGSLPGGLTLSGSGTISGSPTELGKFEFTAQVRDSGSRTASATFTIVAVDLLVPPSSATFNATLGQPYSRSLQATGGTPPYKWTHVSGQLPSGMNLSAEGVVSGTPTQSGDFYQQVTVQDSGAPGQRVEFSLLVRVWKNLAIVTSSLPAAVVTHAYHAQVEAAGGTPPYTWSLVGGSLPTGLTFDTSTAEVSGTPTQTGIGQILVGVSDSSTPPQTTNQSVYVTINPTVSIESRPLNDGVKDRSYWDCLYPQDGQRPYTIKITSGALPPGLVLYQLPVTYGCFSITGTPTALGTYPFTLQITDSSSPPDNATVNESLRVNEQVLMTTTSLPQGLTGDPYSASYTVVGGVTPYRFHMQTALPQGLAFDSQTGQISGIPTQPFDDFIFVSVLDSSAPPQSASTHLELKIVGRLAVTTSRLPARRPSVPCRVTLGVFGGTAPYTWSIKSGTLPSGLSLSPFGGQITGTPTAEGTASFTVQVTDTGPPVQTTSKALSLTISNSLGRNDAIATATPISNGTFRASISPYADPVSGPSNPDTDYYALTANPGAVVTVETRADRLTPPSPFDTVVEIVNAAGSRFSTCRPGWDTYGSFIQPCLNDDLDLAHSTFDSKLYFQVPGTPGTPATFYVRVLDWSGNARPDFVYDLVISGAN